MADAEAALLRQLRAFKAREAAVVAREWAVAIREAVLPPAPLPPPASSTCVPDSH